MTFPNDFRYPGELPTFRVAGHTFSDVGVAEDIAYEQGEDRTRQIYSFNAQLVSVSTPLLTQAEFNLFSAWYENDLRAGTRRFDALVAQQGGLAGLHTAWWEAQFVGRYRWVARRGRYEVSAELLLLDGPYDTRTAPSLRAHALGDGLATVLGLFDATVRAWAVGEGEVTAAMPLPALMAWAEGDGEVTAFPGHSGHLLLEDAFFLLLEGGADRLYIEP